MVDLKSTQTNFHVNSWNQRYQNETADLLEDLTGRLRELEVRAGTRRPSTWHQSSTGSIGGNNGGSQYGSPHNSAQGPLLYQSPPPMQNFAAPPARPAYGHAGSSQEYITTQYQQQQPAFPQQGSNMPQSYPVQPPGYAAPQQYGFSDPSASITQPAFNTNPHSQFGHWGGYGGPSVPDTLDEENAVPPNSTP